MLMATSLLRFLKHQHFLDFLDFPQFKKPSLPETSNSGSDYVFLRVNDNMIINSLTSKKILDWSKLKACADDKMNVT